MPLITRVARLFRADFHAVLDRIEEPDVLLRQALREMEEGLAQEERALHLLDQECTQLKLRESELQQIQTALDEELGICLDADNDHLARTLLKRRLENTRVLQLLAQRLVRTEQRQSTMRQGLDEDRARYQGMRQKAEWFEEQNRNLASDSQHGEWEAIDVAVTKEDVEVALLREKQRRSAS